MPETFWTIEVEGGEEKSCADWGINYESMERRLKSQSVSTVTMRATVQDWKAAPLFAEGAILIFRQDREVDRFDEHAFTGGSKWFYGRVTGLPRQASGRRQSMDYVVSDPWYWLDNVVFRQSWREWDQTYSSPGVPADSYVTKYTTHVLLPFKRGVSTWDILKTDDQIIEALEFARTLAVPPAPMLIGTVQTRPAGYDGGTVPLNEYRDIVCSEVVKHMLKWSPDAVTWFDYTTALPTFHCKRWADLPAVTIPCGGDSGVIINASLRPCYELQRPATQFFFEKQNTVGDKILAFNTEQIWPASATGFEVKGVVQTFDLQGFKLSIQKSDVTVSPLEHDDADLPTRVEWWKNHHQFLKDIRISDIVVTDVESDETLSLPNELDEKGMIADWMLNGEDAVEVEDIEIRARISYKRWADDAHTVLESDPAASNTTYPIAVKLTSTDAITQLYTNSEVTQQQEPEPLGLARFFQEALQVLHWEGSLTIKERQIANRIGLGNRVNVSGGPTDLMTMNAMVTEILDNVGRRETTVTFGPPPWLSAQDMIAVMQVNRRQRFRFTSPQTAQTGQTDVGGSVNLSGRVGRPNSTGGMGGGSSHPPTWLV